MNKIINCEFSKKCYKCNVEVKEAKTVKKYFPPNPDVFRGVFKLLKYFPAEAERFPDFSDVLRKFYRKRF